MTACLRSNPLLGLLLVAACLGSSPAMADTIFSAVEDDGSISLSNMQTTRRFKPLVVDTSSAPSAGAAADRRATGPGPLKKALFDDVVEQTARTYGLDSSLLHAVISVESRYDPAAQSKKGAGGLMQLMPVTAKRYGVADVFDPVQNLQGGAKYLRDLIKLFDSDLNLVLAAYNAGENAVARYGNQIPPFRETADYVPRVLSYYRKYQADSQRP